MVHITVAVLALATLRVAAMPDQGVTSRIENVASQPVIEGGVGRVNLAAGNVDATFCIYSITGQLLKSVRVPADSRVSVDLPKGFYIVRYNNQWSRKVVVK